MPAAAARTLTLMNILASCPTGLTLSQLAHRTGIARASLGRLLDSLVSEQIVVADIKGGRYSASLRVWEPAAVLMTERRVREVAFPYMVELSRAVSSQVNLTLSELPETVGVETVSTMGERVMSRLLYTRQPALANASGRVIAAFVSEEARRSMFALPRERFTTNTVTDEPALRDELAKIRANGFATNDREQDPNVSGVAAPLFDANGCPVGALGLSRRAALDQAFVELAAPLAVAIAQRISAALGFRAADVPQFA